jgi:hypothetical protein
MKKQFYLNKLFVNFNLFYYVNHLQKYYFNFILKLSLKHNIFLILICDRQI